MKTESIIYGTMILIITNSIVKLMSLVYRGITVRLISAEGLGLMEIMMPLYSLLIVISSMGIPPAMSNMISAERSQKSIRSIVRTGTLILFVGSITVIILTISVLPFFNEIIFSDKRIIPGFYVLIPSVLLISIFSSLRSYFQGSRQSSVIGKSQVAEQTARLIFGILLISLFIEKNATLSAILMGVAFASFLAEACGGLYLLKKYRKQRSSSKGKFQQSLAKKMLRHGAPITLSRLILSATTALQAVIVPYTLMVQGATHSEAATFYGLFAGVALTILHLPSIVTGALITPLIPAIAEANSRRNNAARNVRIAKSITFTNITALPILALLYYYADNICALLFASPEAGPMLSLLCLGGIFLYLQHPIVAILQGMNKFRRILIHYIIANTLYIGALFCLQLKSLFTMELFILTFILNDIIIFTLNYAYLKKITGFKINISKAFLAPCIALTSGFLILVLSEKCLMQTNITNILSMILSACLFLLCYVFTLYISGALDKKTISSLLSLHKHR